MIKITKAEKDDLNDILELYTNLHDNQMPIIDERIKQIWNDIINDKNHYVILGRLNEKLVSSCVIVIIQNLTHSQRPYALIENVVTNINYRSKGYASEILNFAKHIAIDKNCYKIMLMTGSKSENVLNFYKKAGYNCSDKTAFIQWLD